MYGMIKPITWRRSGVCPGSTSAGAAGATPFLNRVPQFESCRGHQVSRSARQPPWFGTMVRLSLSRMAGRSEAATRRDPPQVDLSLKLDPVPPCGRRPGSAPGGLVCRGSRSGRDETHQAHAMYPDVLQWAARCREVEVDERDRLSVAEDPVVRTGVVMAANLTREDGRQPVRAKCESGPSEQPSGHQRAGFRKGRADVLLRWAAFRG